MSENTEGGGGDVVGCFNFPDVDATVKFPTGFLFFFFLNNIRIIITVLE